MDPATDFRGGGFLALECLCDLHGKDPILFQKLMHKSEGQRSEWEYPFAVAGVNVTFNLTEMLQLRNPVNTPTTPHARGFVQLLEIDEDAFNQLFCIMFELLDKNWLDMKASYMEFPAVMKYPRFVNDPSPDCFVSRKTRKQIEEALAHQPRTLHELKTLLAL